MNLLDYTNLYFIIAVFGGSILAYFSIANLFKFLFSNYPLYIWSFFFGLIIASILFVGKKINKWDKSSVIALAIGTTIALSFTNISPASENDNYFCIFLRYYWYFWNDATWTIRIIYINSTW